MMKNRFPVVSPLALIMCALTLAACKDPEPVRIPDELNGVWKTDAIQYDGRFFEFRPGRVLTLGTGSGDDDKNDYYVADLQRNEDAGLIRFEVSYKDKEQVEQIFALFYDPDDESIRFKNQDDIVWSKVN